MRIQSHSRRDFLKAVSCAAGGWAVGGAWGAVPSVPELHEALFYDRLEKGRIRCRLCPKQCIVPDGARGYCGVRENRKGSYYTLVYGRPVTMHNDPIEKKPFVHVYPGSKAFSIATVGCNFDCKFCQNWSISQADPDDGTPRFVAPAEIARRAGAAGARTIAFTYGEPTIFYEYMLDCAAAGRAAGLGSLLVTNGFINEEPLKKLLPLLTAVKVDLKSFSPAYYRDICAGELEPVLRTLKTIVAMGVWLELVILVVPTLNDADAELRAMADWVVKELGPNVPMNFIRFYPQYKLRHLPSTPEATLRRAHDAAAAAGCNFVYATGVEGTTYCPACRARLVERFRDVLLNDRMAEAKCSACGAAIPGVWR